MLAKEKWQIKTIAVLERVFEERTRQVAQYGHNEDVQDGTGAWLTPFSDADAEAIEVGFRRDYEDHELTHGLPTWMHLVREEFAEAMKAEDEEELIAELIQVAALCVSWVEKKVGSPALASNGGGVL